MSIRDDLSFGRLAAFSTPDSWWSMRRDSWKSSAIDQEEVEALTSAVFLPNERNLSRGRHIVLWVGTGLMEQLLLPWLPRYLRASGIDPERLRVIQVPSEERIVFARRAALLAAGPPKWLRDSEVRYLSEAWEALIAPEPGPLTEFLRTSNPHLQFLVPALRHLVQLYPDARSGLSLQDEMLLTNVRDHGPRSARCIGHTLSQLQDSGDRVGDGTLFWRLLRLARAAHPAVAVVGDGLAMRSTDVSLTDLGRELLARRVNFVHLNGIDEWIAGVHLDSASGRVWFRRDGALV